MRATTTITWLLLSLSFLLHSVCSNDDNLSATSVSKNETPVTSAPTGGSAAGIQPTVSGRPQTADTTGIPTDAGVQNKSSQAPASAHATAAITTPAATVTAAPKPTIKPGPTQPQAPTVTNNPAVPPSTASISGGALTVVNDSTPAAATPTLPKAVTQVATADSNNSSVVSPNTATIQTPDVSLPSKTTGTEPPTRLSGNTVNVVTTKTPQVSTDALTKGKEPTVHTTITSKTTLDDSKDSTVNITVTVKGPVQTASGAPVPSGNTATTLTPSTLTKAGPPAVGTLDTKAGTTSLPATPTTPPTTSAIITPAQPKTFSFSLNKGQEKEEKKELAEVCKRLMVNLEDGNCTLTWRHHKDKIQFDCVEIKGKVKTSVAVQYYEEITRKQTDYKTLIAILASCGALLIMIVILAVCASHHRRPYNENQQHLTEELHTVENGYHDNPTLEVMEVQPEMQEKKMALNGEFNDSWIVPIDNLLKEDIPDEEDTHL